MYIYIFVKYPEMHTMGLRQSAANVYLKSLLQQITIVLHFIAVKLFIEYNNDNNLLLIGMNT